MTNLNISNPRAQTPDALRGGYRTLIVMMD